MASSSRVTQTWNPKSYLRFSPQRLRPALDLLGQIEHSDPRQIADVGCGTGNITPFLKERWPQARILCLDSSKEMLDQARSNHKNDPGMDINKIDYKLSDYFDAADRKKQQEPLDIIFSNAALHWVGFDIHKSLLQRYMCLLNPNGVLAFQMPDTRAQNSHLMMRRAMKDLGFDHIVRWVTTEVDPDKYYDLLSPQCAHINMWTTTFVHSMEGENPVADFTASTGLGPYVEALGGPTTSEGEAFLQKYRELIQNAYPKQKDGTTLFSMKRFFLVAQK